MITADGHNVPYSRIGLPSYVPGIPQGSIILGNLVYCERCDTIHQTWIKRATSPLNLYSTNNCPFNPCALMNEQNPYYTIIPWQERDLSIPLEYSIRPFNLPVSWFFRSLLHYRNQILYNPITMTLFPSLEHWIEWIRRLDMIALLFLQMSLSYRNQFYPTSTWNTLFSCCSCGPNSSSEYRICPVYSNALWFQLPLSIYENPFNQSLQLNPSWICDCVSVHIQDSTQHNELLTLVQQWNRILWPLNYRSCRSVGTVPCYELPQSYNDCNIQSNPINNDNKKNKETNTDQLANQTLSNKKGQASSNPTSTAISPPLNKDLSLVKYQLQNKTLASKYFMCSRFQSSSNENSWSNKNLNHCQLNTDISLNKKTSIRTLPPKDLPSNHNPRYKGEPNPNSQNMRTNSNKGFYKDESKDKLPLSNATLSTKKKLSANQDLQAKNTQNSRMWKPYKSSSNEYGTLTNSTLHSRANGTLTTKQNITTRSKKVSQTYDGTQESIILNAENWKDSCKNTPPSRDLTKVEEIAKQIKVDIKSPFSPNQLKQNKTFATMNKDSQSKLPWNDVPFNNRADTFNKNSNIENRDTPMSKWVQGPNTATQSCPIPNRAEPLQQIFTWQPEPKVAGAMCNPNSSTWTQRPIMPTPTCVQNSPKSSFQQHSHLKCKICWYEWLFTIQQYLLWKQWFEYHGVQRQIHQQPYYQSQQWPPISQGQAPPLSEISRPPWIYLGLPERRGTPPYQMSSQNVGHFNQYIPHHETISLHQQPPINQFTPWISQNQCCTCFDFLAIRQMPQPQQHQSAPFH